MLGNVDGRRWCLGLWLLGVSAKGTAALELGLGGTGMGHPVFKALEPWETRQAKGDGGGAGTASMATAVESSAATEGKRKV